MIGDRFGGVVAEDYRVRVDREQSVGENEVDALGVSVTFPTGDFAVDGILTVRVLSQHAGVNHAAGSHICVAFIAQMRGRVKVAAE